MKQTDIFFLSSLEMIHENCFFDGFAFFESDLVMGEKGYEDFIKTHSNHEMYADGNYVLVTREENGKLKITRDYHGYYPLYYFKNTTSWFISSSLKYLIEQLIKNDITLTLNKGVAELWKSNLALALQASTHETIAEQVKLLPIDQDILIEEELYNSNLNLTHRIYEENITSYESAISNCLSIWNNRYNTILKSNEVALHQDLTGGLDSRTLLSFLLSQGDLEKNFALNKLKINSNPAQEEDYAIAQNIANSFNFPINSKISDSYKLKKNDGLINYHVWETFNVGRYAPIIFPLTDFNAKLIELGGEGGGDNRPFYGKKKEGGYLSFENYLTTYKKYFSKNNRYDQWRSCVLDSLKTIKEARQETNLSDSILHYREFRSTHHTSKNPRNRLKLGVLGSKHFDQIMYSAPIDKIINGQVFYDVMNSNYYKLLFLPFDSLSKSPSAINILNMLDISNIKHTKTQGKIYSSQSIISSNLLKTIDWKSSKYNDENGLQVLINTSKESLSKNSDLINDLFGSEYSRSIKEKVNNLDYNTKSLNLHSSGSYLHTLRLADLISKFI